MTAALGTPPSTVGDGNIAEPFSAPLTGPRRPGGRSTSLSAPSPPVIEPEQQRRGDGALDRLLGGLTQISWHDCEYPTTARGPLWAMT